MQQAKSTKQSAGYTIKLAGFDVSKGAVSFAATHSPGGELTVSDTGIKLAGLNKVWEIPAGVAITVTATAVSLTLRTADIHINLLTNKADDIVGQLRSRNYPITIGSASSNNKMAWGVLSIVLIVLGILLIFVGVFYSSLSKLIQG